MQKHRTFLILTCRQVRGRESSKARSTSRFIVPPCASGNSAPVQASGAPVSGVRFAVGTLPRCASALSAEFPSPDLPARISKKRRRFAFELPSVHANRFLRLICILIHNREKRQISGILFRTRFLEGKASSKIRFYKNNMARLCELLCQIEDE